MTSIHPDTDWVAGWAAEESCLDSREDQDISSSSVSRRTGAHLVYYVMFIWHFLLESKEDGS